MKSSSKGSSRRFELFDGQARQEAGPLIRAQASGHAVLFQTEPGTAAFSPYDRITPQTPQPLWPDALLSELARVMSTYPAKWARHTFDAVGIPAAYTYFGQLVAHDLTWIRQTETRDGVECLPARLDFASIWDGNEHHIPDAAALGRTSDGRAGDVPRSPCGAPRLDDARNDQNLTLSQLVVLILKFGQVVAQGQRDARAIRRRVRQHLQWITLHDFLPRLMDPVVYRDVMQSGACPLLEGGAGFVPIEFAAASFRLGHAMVRERYPHWRRGGDGASLSDLVNFTHHSRATRLVRIEQATRLPGNWTAGWSHLLESDHDYRVSRAAAIDENLAHSMFALPDTIGDCAARPPDPPATAHGVFNLAEHTLIRGARLRIPAAQEICQWAHERLQDADAALLPRRLSPLRLTQTRSPELCDFLCSDTATPLREATPLWFYLLREADAFASGQHFGPLASRITMETIYRAIKADPEGILNTDFTPDLANDTGTFGLKDLHHVVQTHWTET